jgi:hypothetical protein
MARPQVADGRKASNIEGKAKKVKATFILEQTTKAQNGSKGMGLHFLEHRR